MTTMNGQISPDPARHAMALVDSLGMSMAWQLVQLYAKDWPMGTYWPRALEALHEQRRRLASERGEGEAA